MTLRRDMRRIVAECPAETPAVELTMLGNALMHASARHTAVPARLAAVACALAADAGEGPRPPRRLVVVLVSVRTARGRGGARSADPAAGGPAPS